MLDPRSRENDAVGRQDVPAAEKDALVNYLAGMFNSSRPRPNTSKVIPEGKGKDVFKFPA